jgi:hypothetical protein
MKPEYSDILYNQTYFTGPLMCRIKQVPLYLQMMDMNIISSLVFIKKQ